MNIALTDELSRVLERLKKKDNALFAQVWKKISQIASLDCITIGHFKNLRGNMSRFKRVHIGSFVLTFQVIEDRIVFEALEHHDRAYKL